MKIGLTVIGILAASVALSPVAMAQQSSPIVVTGKYQKQFDKGAKLEAQGMAELEKARKNLLGHSSDVSDAQSKRDAALQRAQTAEAEFRKLTGSVQSFTDAAEARKWARQVEASAEEWAKYDDRRADGRSDLDSSSKSQGKAQAAVDKAQAKIDQGRQMQAEARRLSAMPRG